MNFLSFAGTILAGLLGWCYGRLNVRSEEKKQQQKRLKRLLYNMLELKNWVDRMIGAEAVTIRYRERMIAGIAARYPEKEPAELVEIGHKISAGLKQMVLQLPQTARLEQTITEIIREFSEIDPFFAYELTGKYQLTETLDLIKNWAAGLVPGADSVTQTSLFLDQLLRPVMLAELQRDLIAHLPQIATQIGKATLTTVQKEHLSTAVVLDSPAMENYCNEMLPRLFASMEQFSASGITVDEGGLLQ